MKGFKWHEKLEVEFIPALRTQETLSSQVSLKQILNGVIVKKTLVLVAWSLVLISELCGVFSINESPSEHVYNPRYDQCETYNITPTTASSIIISHVLYNPTINSTVFQINGTVDITIEDIAIYPSFEVFIDGNTIENYITSGIDISFGRQLNLGTHTIKADWINFEGDNDSFSLDFDVISKNYYYQNSYARLYLCTNDQPDCEAIRPVLFVEGFSAQGIISGGYSYTQSLVSKWESSLSDCKIYILSLSNPSQDLRNNAMIVLGALRFIHNVQPTNKLLEGTSIFGYSMGGILARYALAFSEHWSIPHFCTQYISLDAPHRGCAVNSKFQDMLGDLEEWMNENRFYIETGGQDADQLDPYLEGLQKKAAKQLIRNNKYAINGGQGSYDEGSTDYQTFYAEINEEERDLLGNNNVLINSNSTDTSSPVKPGFPYKQNNIKSLAYANGSLFPSGLHNNISTVADYYIHIHLEGGLIDGLLTTSDQKTAPAEPYDCQPGSVLDDIGAKPMCHAADTAWWGHYSFDLNQYYAPVLVPTRSSLYLKPTSVAGGDAIPALNMDDYSSLSQYENTILSHTLFDQIIYAPNVPSAIDTLGFAANGPVPHYNEFNQWNWKHGELGWLTYPHDDWVNSNISTSANWLNLTENRTVCTIRGRVNDSDYSSITGKMLINGQENRAFTINPDGSYEVPYLYTRDAQVRLVIKKPGCLPSYRDLLVSHSEAMLQDYTVTDANMFALDLNNIIVSQTGSGSFQTINSAIDFLDEYVHSALYVDTPIRIKIMTGTYNEMIDLSQLTDTPISSLTLKGWGENVIIDPEFEGTCISMVGQIAGNIIIDNLTLTNALGGIVVEIANGMRLTVNNCTISNCQSSDFVGLAIRSNIPSTITSCSIMNNRGIDESTGASITAGLYLYNHTIYPTIVSDCKIRNNYARNASALRLGGSGHFDILNNDFWFNDPNQDSKNPDPYKYIVQMINAGSVNFHYNTILEDGIPNCIEISQSGWDPCWVDVRNNTFRRVGNCVTSQGDRVKVINNIMEYCLIGISSEDQSNSLQIRNNIFDRVTTPFQGIEYDPVLHPGCQFINEDIIDNNNIPIWTCDYMSPCIDSGTGVMESDKTPPDIGAFRATDHRYWQYRFRSGENDRSDTYHWVSYPVVNSLTQGKTNANLFFHELLGTHEIAPQLFTADVLQEILWRDTYGLQVISWNGIGWGDDIDAHNVVSPQGYKVKLLPVANNGLPPTSVELHHSGFLTPENTPFWVYGSASNGGQTYENWIGYFDTESVWPTDAFASIWNDITMIKAKDWCLYRDPNSGIGAIIGKMLPINCGDMVIVTTVNDHEFQWNTTVPTDPKKKEVPTAFEYVEKADYTPVYIDLSAVDLSNLKEIGLKLDGICKGAVVVTDSLEQICAYLEEGESLSSGLVELVFFYESKSQALEMSSVSVKDNQLSSSIIGSDSAYPVYNIKITPDDLTNSVTPVLSLEQNYPNPFNPTTIIRYSIEKPGSTSLDIYNIKGQLVKSLYHGNAEIGAHTVVWNGLDNSGNACSSGVYFYRLRTPNKSLVRKMLMLK